MTLAEWLRGCLDQAERRDVYNTVLSSGGWPAPLVLECMVGKIPDLLALKRCPWRVDASDVTQAERADLAHEHSKTHARAGVLDELARKRSIVDLCEADLRERGGGALEGRVDRPTWQILTVLAGEFAGWPGWREDWASERCRHCTHRIVPHPDTSTGWTHGDVRGSGIFRWSGVRCPGRLTGAEP